MIRNSRDKGRSEVPASARSEASVRIFIGRLDEIENGL